MKNEMSGRGLEEYKRRAKPSGFIILDFPLIRSVFCVPTPTSSHLQPTAMSGRSKSLKFSAASSRSFNSSPRLQFVKINNSVSFPATFSLNFTNERGYLMKIQ